MPDFQSSPELTTEIPGTSIDIASLSVAGLRQAMTDGELTATALTRRYLDRIADVNPALGAVIAASPDALDQAAASDAAIQAGQPRGALEGIPVLVKDNVQVAGAPATAGSPALLAARPPDAFIVSRLRAAGAIILAKANLSEWANFRSTRSTSGWSTLGGQTANPYALDRNPSGLELGLGGGAVGGLRAARRRHGDGRVDRLPVKRLRRGRHQADPRPRQPGRHRAAVPGAGHRGPDGHLGRGRGGAAVGARRRRPRRLRGRSSRRSSTTRHSSTRRRWKGRGSASGGRPRPARTPRARRCSTRRSTASPRSVPR